jgi:predicted membrane chloride channel (bestrophin family)
MRKFQEVFNVLTEFRSVARGFNTKVIKTKIGDSIENNRTITVSQAIRFATKIGLRRTALLLEVTNAIMEEEILSTRTSRTDAIDLNELVTTYRNVVMNNGKLRREIGSAVAKVG